MGEILAAVGAFGFVILYCLFIDSKRRGRNEKQALAGWKAGENVESGV